LIFRWADQCPTYAVGHDKSRLVVGFKYVGQNIAWSGGANSIDKGLSGMVQMWYDEVINTSVKSSILVFLGMNSHRVQSISMSCGKLKTILSIQPVYLSVKISLERK